MTTCTGTIFPRLPIVPTHLISPQKQFLSAQFEAFMVKNKMINDRFANNNLINTNLLFYMVKWFNTVDGDNMEARIIIMLLSHVYVPILNYEFLKCYILDLPF